MFENICFFILITAVMIRAFVLSKFITMEKTMANIRQIYPDTVIGLIISTMCFMTIVSIPRMNPVDIILLSYIVLVYLIIPTCTTIWLYCSEKTVARVDEFLIGPRTFFNACIDIVISGLRNNKKVDSKKTK